MLQLTAPSDETVVASSAVPGPSFWRPPDLRFGFIVTRAAIYVPVPRSGFHVRERLEQRRIPLADLSTVSLTPASPWSPTLVLGLLVMSMWLAVFVPHFREHGFSWRSLGFPLMIAPGTVRAILGAFGRLRLRLITPSESIDFAPEATATPFRGSKRRASALQRAFVEACREVGVPVTLHPNPSAPPEPA